MESPSRPPRRIRTLSEARDLVAAWKASGLNKEAWCRSQGVLRSALLSWLSRVEAQGDGADPPSFIELRPPAEAPAAAVAESASLAPIILELGFGMRVLGMDTTHLVDLIRSLRQERS
jgi:hypothetical protein